MNNANQSAALPMKLEIRLAILFGCLLAIFLGVLALLHASQRRSAFELQTEIAGDKARQLARALALTGSTLERFAADYTQWDEMGAYVQTADPTWAEINLDQSLVSWRFHGLWVFSPEKRLVSRHLRVPLCADDVAAFPRTEILAHITSAEHTHFFLRTPRGLLEIRGSAIHPSDERRNAEPPQGWLVVAHWWSPNLVAQLGELTDSTVTIVSATPATPSAELGPKITANLPLPSWDGRPAAHLELEHTSPLLINMSAYDRGESYLLFGFGLVFLACAAICTHYWVRRPLHLIQRSLVSSRPELVAPLEGHRDEFGQVARLVRTVSEQRHALSREVEDRTFAESELRHAIAERAALGRDLHDGVIQSIYAIGMSLQGVVTLLHTAPKQAHHVLETCIDGLNRCIAQLRAHIAGLESDGTPPASLAEGLQTLLRELRPVRAVNYDVRLDPLLAAALPQDSIAQLLYIAREALSNALRHSQARRIALVLGTTGSEPTFTIEDDGCGFDPAATVGHRGHGLDNMTRRAEEIGATLSIESVPGRGTRLRVELPRPGFESATTSSTSSSP